MQNTSKIQEEDQEEMGRTMQKASVEHQDK